MKHVFGAVSKTWARMASLPCLLGLGVLLAAGPAHAEAYTLQKLTEIALATHPVIQASQAQREAALAGITSATAWINPQLEIGAGPTRYRYGDSTLKNNWGVAISQPLEYSDVRQARRSVAEAGVRVAESGVDMARAELRNQVRTAFFDLLQRQLVHRLIEEDHALLVQIRDRVRLRVEVGEAPQYELIKAETEVLAAERELNVARVRVGEGRILLRGLVGPSLPEEFQLQGELPDEGFAFSLDELMARFASSPKYQQVLALRESAEAKLHLEEELRNPGLTLRVGVEQDPDLTNLRFGVGIPLPVWNQRQGPIAEAAAGVMQADALQREQEISARRVLGAAYERYRIAQEQVEAYETGLLAQAEAVLKVAEAAYRYGERGILDYLDAQRTYRSVRKDHIAARHALATAILDIERLLGTELLKETL